ncbi:uncharacterized protein M6B38_292680 [Iris pallida]|uniref:YLP motif-containing protein 1 n=1 Tax=Iris pallida TaxID=29817 RepID=A0AAX6HTR5_IRIPA|nr:uncharacterized protein M6B38_292680 [Iris pallida]
MEDSWRFRPLQPHHPPCPVCSAPHFPFCPPPPPPPSFERRIGFDAGDGLRRFAPDPLFRRHDHPPFPDHRPPPPFPPREPPPLPPQHRFPPHPHEEDLLLEREAFFRKRMRVEDPNPLGFPSDDERRLNLIRSHGCQQPQPQPPGFRGGSGPILPPEPLPFPENPRFLPQEARTFDTGSDRFDTIAGGSRRPHEQFSSQIGQIEPPPHRRCEYDQPDAPYRLQAQGYNREEQSFYGLRPPLPSPAPVPPPPPIDRRPTESALHNSQPKQPHYSSSYHATMPNAMQESRADPQFQHSYHEEIWKPSEPPLYRPLHEDAPNNNFRLGRVVDGRVHALETFPPLPPQPPLPPPPEPSPPRYHPATSPVRLSSSMPSHVPASTLALAPLVNPDSSRGSSEVRPPAYASFYNETTMHSSTGLATEGLPFRDQTPSKEYLEGRQETFRSRRFLEDKPTVVDACRLFKQPHRASRPDHFVIILRGLPGSGKSYLAKMLRNLEVEAGGNAPRIHAMDDYFMIEVEKVEESEGTKSSSSFRGKKQITKKVIEYCYEPEMEEAYRSSMLKAFKKTLEDGNFTFIIVDDRNLRVADFAQFWAIAKRSGYEVYMLEAAYKDPVGCAARNVHGFTVDDIQKMAKQWEEAPPLYMRLDIKSLFRGDDLDEQSIQEVDMDIDDAVCDVEEPNKLLQREDLKMKDTKISDNALDTGSVKVGERWNAEEEEEHIGVTELGRSKWSKDEEIDKPDGSSVHLTALSGLVQAYGKGEKSVHWGDHVDQSGFSIGAFKKHNRVSLIIGPGSGYNLISNPLPVEEDALEAATRRSNGNESKSRFTEQLRAERESFKAVFDRRRHRIGGLRDAEDE